MSYELPALHPVFAIPCETGEGNHTVGFTRAAGLLKSHQLTLNAATGIAVATWKFIVDKEYAGSVKEEFRRMKEDLRI